MKILHKVLSSIFPKRRDFELIEHESAETFIDYYQTRTHESVITLASFAEPAVRAAIHEAKYHNNDHAFSLLGALLNQYLTNQKPFLILPIPLTRNRKRKRGYNQVEQVLFRTKDHNHTINTKTLQRIKDSVPQTKLRRSERLENVRGAFTISNTQPSKLNGAHILIVDDVVTTGATMRAAKAALLPHHPASITCVALAH